MEKYHRNIISQFIAYEMYEMIYDKLAFEQRSIIRHIKEKYKYNIPYMKNMGSEKYMNFKYLKVHPMGGRLGLDEQQGPGGRHKK
jgi:hypothetical protein